MSFLPSSGVVCVCVPSRVCADVVLNLRGGAVDVSVKSRVVTVKGPRGTLSRSFSHAQVDMRLINKKTIQIDMWHASRTQQAVLRTLSSHITNLITGVTKARRKSMFLGMCDETAVLTTIVW